MSKEHAAKVMQEIFIKGTYEGDLLGIGSSRSNQKGGMMDAYQRWWDTEGSAMRPHKHEDLEEFARRITEIAWSNGQFVEKEACAQVVDDFGDEWMCDAHQLAKIIRERGRT